MAYTVNTLGAILGALVVGFGMLPVLGLRGSFVGLVLANLTVGAVIVARAAPRYSALAAGGAVAVAAISATI